MKLTKKDIKKIKKDKIFKKRLKDKTIWIKPIIESNYKKGDINAHQRFFKILEMHLKKYIPKRKSYMIKIDSKNYLVNYIKHIDGKNLSEKNFTKGLNLKINFRFREGMIGLLKKGYVLDFYGKRNFMQKKDGKIYYVDTRMPLFTKKTNEGERFEISKNKTIKFLK